MPKGRGFGAHVKGERIESVDQLHVGDLLLEYSPAFDAENTVLVKKEFENRVWACFVNPHDWTERQGNDFCIWGFDIVLGTMHLFRVSTRSAQ